MKKMHGFTLIELLAVIVILAIIAVIATPLTINVINNAKQKSFINSVYGLIDGVRLLSAEQLFDDCSNEVVVNFTDGVADNTNFKVSGDMPNSGTLHLKTDGKVELKVWSEELGKCAEKSVTESEVHFTTTTKENCKLEVKVNTSTGQTVREIMEEKLESGETAYDTTDDHNLRYVGQSPNNYVKFNGEELWRIIGVFDGQTKIISANYYSKSIPWDSDYGDYGNYWPQSTLKSGLNNGYIKKIETNDLTSYNYIDLDYTWDIGENAGSTSTRLEFYNAERSGETWQGAIGLMYPSDYGYSTNGNATICDSEDIGKWSIDPAKTECAENSWLYDSDYYQWTLISNNNEWEYVFIVNRTGSISSNLVYGEGQQGYGISSGYATRPALFLKSNVKIIDGKGTPNEPYTLGT